MHRQRSTDGGATWAKVGNEKHIVLAGMDGVFQTVDDGAHWTKVAPFPNDISKPGNESFAWDTVHNIVYAAARNAPAEYCQLPPPAIH